VPSRFQILADDLVLVPNRTSPTTTTSNLTRVVHKRDIPLGWNTHYYNTNAGTVADIDSGSITMFMISLTAVKVTSYWYSARLLFRDL
jgi:hypothetical protein